MTQEAALTILKTGANVFLTGEPGSGKTHTVNQYIAYLRAHGIEPAITASTGIAATHVGGMTIHSWSGVGIKSALSANDLEELSSREPLVKRIANAKVLIIDEISMLDSRILHMVETVCRTLRRNEEAFGGLQIIFVGDFFQLPPVVRAGEPPLKFCFESKAWALANPVVCYLTEQHRQKDDILLEALALVRRGEGESGAREHFETRLIEDAYDEGVSLIPKLFTHNADVDRMNNMELAKLPGKAETFVMNTKGKPGVIETLKRGCLSPEELCLKEDAVVMFTKNNFDQGYVNGTLGTVIGFEADTLFPVVKLHNGEEITVSHEEWALSDNGKVLGAITQIPLRLAWAITIHKSQGMSMDAAVINLGSAFEYGQGYVALSRVRSLSGMFLLGLNERALMVHPTILARDEQFQELSRQAQVSFEELGEAQLATLHRNFLIANGGRLETPPTRTKAGKGSRPYDIDALRAKHPNIGASWDRAQEETLTELFKAGHNTKAIAEQMGRKSGGIRARLKLLGLIAGGTLKPLRTTKAKTNKVNTLDETWRLVAEGLPLDEIAAARGLSKGTIIKHLEDERDLREDIDIAYLMDEIGKETFDRIAKAFASTEGTDTAGRLAPVKALVGDDISYDEIRLAKLFL